MRSLLIGALAAIGSALLVVATVSAWKPYPESLQFRDVDLIARTGISGLALLLSAMLLVWSGTK